MSIYETYCREQFGAQGRLSHIGFHWPDNFNFGYDVVDAIAEKDPDKRALVWRGAEGKEKTFTFGDIRRLSNQAANVFRQAGIGRGDYVMVALKRHWEYWYAAVALHKLRAVMVPVTHMLTVKDLLYRMDCLTLKGILSQNAGPAQQPQPEAGGGLLRHHRLGRRQKAPEALCGPGAAVRGHRHDRQRRAGVQRRDHGDDPLQHRPGIRPAIGNTTSGTGPKGWPRVCHLHCLRGIGCHWTFQIP